MGDKSKIEWADATWNPIVGCSRVSPGCANCYAERVAHRGMAEQHRGLTIFGEKGPRWNGEVRFVPHVLDKPLRWKKRRRIFVNSLSDLFHDKVSDEQVAAVFGVMAAAEQHTFQVLTKRPQRMAQWFRQNYEAGPDEVFRAAHDALHAVELAPGDAAAERALQRSIDAVEAAWGRVAMGAKFWPLENVWIGVSAENQAMAKERIPLLLEVPAALRWVSYEPALGPIDWEAPFCDEGSQIGWVPDWVVIGGESGPGARPFNVAWAFDTINRFRDSRTKVFVKQLGADPWYAVYDGPFAKWTLGDSKGGVAEEWPEWLRVREMPEVSGG